MEARAHAPAHVWVKPIDLLAPLQLPERIATRALREVRGLNDVLINLGPALARDALPKLERAVPVVEQATGKVDGLTMTVDTASDKVDPLLETMDRAVPVVQEAIDIMREALPVLERVAELAGPLEGTAGRLGRLSDRLPGGPR